MTLKNYLTFYLVLLYCWSRDNFFVTFYTFGFWGAGFCSHLFLKDALLLVYPLNVCVFVKNV